MRSLYEQEKLLVEISEKGNMPWINIVRKNENDECIILSTKSILLEELDYQFSFIFFFLDNDVTNNCQFRLENKLVQAMEMAQCTVYKLWNMMSSAPSSSEGVYFYIHDRAVLTVDEARDLSPYKNAINSWEWNEEF
jgi:hypothetical protein